MALVRQIRGTSSSTYLRGAGRRVGAHMVRGAFKSKLMAALETVEMSEEPWEEFHTAGNRNGMFDHITKLQSIKGGKKGGKATIASHGEQLGNGGRKSSRLFP